MRKPRKKKLLIALIILVILAAAVELLAAQDTRFGRRRKAEAGDARSQYYLGLDYYHGTGAAFLRQDYAEAARWWRLAADNDSVTSGPDYRLRMEAAYRLGDLYHHGRGVPQDDAEAEKWWRRGAEDGSHKNRFDLGERYYYGRGVKKDVLEAAKWWRLAIRGFYEPGKIAAEYHLGKFYQDGGDPSEAAEWFRRAIEHSRYYDIDKEDRWQACEANYSLGELHFEGRGVPQDYAEAAKRYRLAAEPGCDHKDAQYRLGILYRQGLGVPKNAEAAARWLSMAAATNRFHSYYAEAKYQLGELYYLGEGVPQDRAMAAKWLCEVRDDVEAAMEALVRWDLDCPK